MTDLTAEKNRRVLVIDDNRAIHEDFRKILSPATNAAAALDTSEAALFGHSTTAVQQTQFEVDSAYQGQEGVSLLRKAMVAGRPYAMAFVDVRMPPGWDGVETTGKLWELDPDLQVVLCTAYSDYSWDEMFEKLGQRDGLLILKKPFDAVEALQLAHALTEKWRLNQLSRRKTGELEGMVADRTQELTRSLSLLNATLESTTDGIVAVDLFGKTVSYNTRFANTWQFPAEMLLRRDASEMRAHAAGQVKDSALFLQRVKNLQANPEAESFDEIELKDGRTFERYAFPQRIGLECVGTVINWRDITGRKQAEAAMRESEERFSSAFEHAPIGVALVSPDGRWLKVNRVLCELVGYSESELLTRSFQDITHPKDLELDLENVRRMIAGEIRSYQIEKRYVHKDGRFVAVLLNVSLVRDGQGRPRYFISQIQDITGRKQVEAQLFQSQKMESVGRLAGGIAHEFNSILTAIIGQSELLLGELPIGSPQATNATEIREAADRAATLTRQLLAYGRKQILQPVILDLNSVLLGMEGNLRQLMGTGSDVRLTSATGLKSIMADAGQIEQVIMNLAMNAADAMPAGGKLTLETANVTLDHEYASRFQDVKAGEYVMLAITDSGAGMSKEVRAHLFEPFFTTKGVGQGSGLGLATCYGIVKQSGGHISVYSELGRGTTFKIYLPEVQAATTMPVLRADSQVLPRGTETILLVDDDPVLLEIAGTFLKRQGYTVFMAASGSEALSLKQAGGIGPVDLLFTDVAMPAMSGKELADRVRALYPDTRILFTSAYTENAIAHQGALDPGVALLQKPFTPSALARKVREVLDSPDPPVSDLALKASDLKSIPVGANPQ
jgi:two-component system cell cycle sensor histidine kinase/response regulator CckA